MIKITRKLLDHYRKIKREIPMLTYELEEMKKGDNGLGNSTIFDYRTGKGRPQSVVGFDWTTYDCRSDHLSHKMEQAQAVETWIDQIEDTETRCVFRMYYIDGMTWEKIAAKTGYNDSPDYPRLHIRDRYLKKMKIK